MPSKRTFLKSALAAITSFGLVGKAAAKEVTFEAPPAPATPQEKELDSYYGGKDIPYRVWRERVVAQLPAKWRVRMPARKETFLRGMYAEDLSVRVAVDTFCRYYVK